MSWANFGSLGGAGNGVAATSISHTTSTYNVSVNQIILTCIVVDNTTSTTDGNPTNEVSSVNDSTGGNTWIKIAEFTNGEGAAGAGCTVAVFMTQPATQINVGSTITATLNSSVTAKGISSYLFSVAAGSTVAIAGAVQTLANDAAPVGSMAISGLTSGEYLFVRAMASEAQNFGSFALTSGFGHIFGGWGYDGGTDAASMKMQGEWDLAAGTGSTSAPTGSRSVDWASVFFALQEVQPTSTLFFGAGV